MPTQRELEEMEQDMFQMEREQIQEICRDVMMREVKDMLVDYETMKLELDALKSGQRVLLPVDDDHARYMLMVAQAYLNQSKSEMWGAFNANPSHS